MRSLFIALILLVFSVPAWADCTTVAMGTQPQGHIFYNSTNKIFQYCSGTTWKPMTGRGSGSGGCGSPSGTEGSMVFNGSHRVLQGCAGNLWKSMGPPLYTPAGVTFNGTSSRVQGTPTGIADSNKMTLSFWFRLNTPAANADMSMLDTDEPGDISVDWLGSGTDVIQIYTVDPTDTFTPYQMVTPAITDSNWHHLLVSFDLSSTSKRHVYLDGRPASVTYVQYTNALIDFTVPNYYLGGFKDNWGWLNGDMAEFWMAPGVYMDLSVEANLRKFIDISGRPVALGPQGALPTGSSPALYFTGASGVWHNNKGSADGAFTVSGGLTAAATALPNPTGPNNLYPWGSVAQATQLNTAAGFDIAGNYAYVAAPGTDRFTVVNISNPYAPAITSSITNALLDAIMHVKVVGNYALATGWLSDRIVTINISNPAAPSIVNNLTHATYLDGPIPLVIRGNYAYVGTVVSNYFTVLDISNPAAPSIVTGITDPDMVTPVDIALDGNYAYVVAEGSDRLFIINIANPASPYIVSSVTHANLDRPVGVTILGNYAYVSAHDLDRITVVDISNKNAPAVVGGLTDATNLDGPRRSVTDGKMLYVAALNGDRMTALNLSNPVSPTVAASAYHATLLDQAWNVGFGSNYEFAYVSRAGGFAVVPLRWNCKAPTGMPGDIVYNSTSGLMQYCDGASWTATGGTVEKCSGSPAAGQVCADGSVYAGMSPDGNVKMYTTPADGGSFNWNDGAGSVNTTMVNCTSNYPGAQASCRTGRANTNLLVSEDSNAGAGGFQLHEAAQYCYDLVAHGKSDWYLPASDEIYIMYQNRLAIGGFVLSGAFPAGYYWSSSEVSATDARDMNFTSGGENGWAGKGGWTLQTRCVRRD